MNDGGLYVVPGRASALRLRGLTPVDFGAGALVGSCSVGDVIRVGISLRQVSCSRIVEAVADCVAADMSQPTINGLDAWTWFSPTQCGRLPVTFSCRTADGLVTTCRVDVRASGDAALVASSVPQYAENAFAFGDVYFPDPTGDAPLLMV